MSTNSAKTRLDPPICGTEICSPLFSWKDCFSESPESTSSEDGTAEGQNQRPPLPTGGQKIVQPKMENTTAKPRQVPFRSLSPLSEISALPHIFDHPFQSVANKTTLTPDFAPSLNYSPSSDSETSSSMNTMNEGSPSLSPSNSDDATPPPQKRMKKEIRSRPIEARSMFRMPDGPFAAAHTQDLPPIAPNYARGARRRENELMRELNQLPSMFHPAALPTILPGENGEEQLSRVSPRLAPTEVKKEKQGRGPNGKKVRSIMSKRQSRKKTNVACTNCVRAKAGCDQGRPCSRCTRLGKPNCVDRPINTRRRRKPARRFVEETMERAMDDDTFKPLNEFIIGSYNGDVDYLDYYMTQAPLSHYSYNPPSSSQPSSDTAIPPPPLPPIPCLNTLAPNSQNGILCYGQTSWASWNPIIPPIPQEDTSSSAGNLFASGDIRHQDLSQSPALSAMDMSKPSQTTMKLETMRPSTTSPNPQPLYYY